MGLEERKISEEFGQLATGFAKIIAKMDEKRGEIIVKRQEKNEKP